MDWRVGRRGPDGDKCHVLVMEIGGRVCGVERMMLRAAVEVVVVAHLYWTAVIARGIAVVAAPQVVVSPVVSRLRLFRAKKAISVDNLFVRR